MNGKNIIVSLLRLISPLLLKVSDIVLAALEIRKIEASVGTWRERLKAVDLVMYIYETVENVVHLSETGRMFKDRPDSYIDDYILSEVLDYLLRNYNDSEEVLRSIPTLKILIAHAKAQVQQRKKVRKAPSKA